MIKITQAKLPTDIGSFIDQLPEGRYSNLTDLSVAVIDFLLILGGALAVLAVAYSGLMYILAGPDSTKAEGAKKNLVWSITGLIIISLSYLIVQWIISAVTTGVI